MAKTKSYWIALLAWVFEFVLASVEYIKENPFPKRADFEEAKPETITDSERNSEARNSELHVESVEGK